MARSKAKAGLNRQPDLQIENQYKRDIFNKIAFALERAATVLDVGCGDGSDAQILADHFGMNVSAIDIYEHQNIERLSNVRFKKGSITQIPFEDNSFDYVFVHDVLHHVEGAKENGEIARRGLAELSRVCKKGGQIIIVEGNRFNPISYPYLVLKHKHDHWSQNKLKRIIGELFPKAVFTHFEAHLYPARYVKLFKIYERFMDRFRFLQPFRSYNVVIIDNE